VIADGNTYYLDASKPMLGFNQLASDCYNGVAWSLTKEAQKQINFLADSLKENNTTTVLFSYDKPGELIGTSYNILGNNASFRFREKMKNTNITTLTNEISKSLIGDIKVSNLSIDSLNQYEQPNFC
jgi:hypothetical protein